MIEKYPNLSLGNKLKTLFKENYTSANEVAKKIGVSPQTLYSLIKRDSTKIDMVVLDKIATELNVDISYFFTDSELINPSGKELLRKFNLLDNFGKEAVLNLVETEYNRCVSTDFRRDTYRIAARGKGLLSQEEIPEDVLIAIKKIMDQREEK
ncbi:MAG: helix-turn-helix transcriptional regulator [Clostridia bacterium]|nr:helix-turn-helix transcriptional regulator [Clostridia bacterium]